MKRIIFASYPRSGSNLLVWYILRLIDDNICRASLCHNYNKCWKVPCECPDKALITKTHDIDFAYALEKHVISDDYLYFINLRKSKFENIEAYARYMLGSMSDNPQRREKIGDEEMPIIKSKFPKYSQDYDGFKEKYVLSKDNFCIIYKEDMVDQPVDMIKKIMKFLGIDRVSDENYIKQILNENPIHFTTIDPEYLSWFERRCQEMIC